MRIVIQRVSEATVTIDKQLYSAIKQGLLILIGIEEEDNQEDIQYLVSKLIALRIFSDVEGKMNLDIKQVNGEFLLVSQFTLHASTKKGNRPSFIKAAKPEKANQLYQDFISEITKLNGQVPKTGVFAADMKSDVKTESTTVTPAGDVKAEKKEVKKSVKKSKKGKKVVKSLKKEETTVTTPAPAAPAAPAAK